jgi:hypothetical protein
VVNKEENQSRRGEEEGNPDTWGHGVSERERKGRRGARACELGQQRLVGLGPNGTRGKKTARAREKRQAKAAGCGAERTAGDGLPAALGWAKSEKRNENPFLFLFPKFQSIFK